MKVERISRDLSRGAKVATLIRELSAKPMTWPEAMEVVGCSSKRTWQQIRADIEAGGWTVQSAGDTDISGKSLHRIYWI